MEKLNFKDTKRLLTALEKLEAEFQYLFDDKKRQEDEIRAVSRQIRTENARGLLEGISVEELKKSRAGIRVSALLDAGYTNLLRLDKAKDWELKEVDGIGDKQIESIRSIIAEFVNSLSAYATVRKLHSFTKEAVSREMITSRVRWIFSGREAKKNTIFAVGELLTFLNSPFCERVKRFIGLYREASVMEPSGAGKDFKQNGAVFYALLEKVGAGKTDKKLVYSSIPEKLAQKIDSLPLNLSMFRGTLRGYQEFGAKYILHQKKVLLGDEMGLGKTERLISRRFGSGTLSIDEPGVDSQFHRGGESEISADGHISVERKREGKMNAVTIRKGKLKDARRLCKIYAHYVEHTAITFEYRKPSVWEFRKRMKRIMKKYPYLVAERDGRVIGFAYAGAFHERAAYGWCVETTIYLEPDAAKKGVGKLLYETLAETLKKMGILNLYACIAVTDKEDEYLTNNSAEFHEHLGFRKIGCFSECGYKFERWYDMIWMEKIVGEHRDKQEPVIFFKN